MFDGSQDADLIKRIFLFFFSEFFYKDLFHCIILSILYSLDFEYFTVGALTKWLENSEIFELHKLTVNYLTNKFFI